MDTTIVERTRLLILCGLIMAGSCLGRPAMAQAPDVIQFGASLSLTGGLSAEAKTAKLGYDFYVKHINERGGIDIGGKKYKVDIKYYDDASNANTAAQLFERLITEDGIKFLLGPYGSGPSLTATAVAEQHRLPMVIAHGASTPIYTRGFKYVFGVLNTIDQYTLPIIKMASEQRPPLKHVALINEDALFPQLGIDGAASQAKEFGLDVVYKEKYPSGIKDLSSQLVKMKTTAPDLIIAGGYTGDMILLARQIKEVGLKPKLLAYLLGPTVPGFIDSLKQDAENTLEPTQWSPNAPWKDQFFGYTALEFAKTFQADFGYWPDYHPPQSAAALEVYQAALQKAGSLDPQKVRDAIAQTDIMTFYGPIRFNDKGENTAKSMGVTQVQDGKPLVVYPADEAEAKLRLN